MIIQCEACKRKFRVDESKINPPGVKVRCSKCGDVFFFEYKTGDEFEAAKTEEFGGENPLAENVEYNQVEQNIDTQTEQQKFSTPDTAIEDSSASLSETDPVAISNEDNEEISETSEFIDKELFDSTSENIDSTENQGDGFISKEETLLSSSVETIEEEQIESEQDGNQSEIPASSKDLFESSETGQQIGFDQESQIEDQIVDKSDSLEKGLLDSQTESSEAEEIPNKEELLEVSLSEIDNIDVSKDLIDEISSQKESGIDIDSVKEEVNKEISAVEENQKIESEELDSLEKIEIDRLDGLVEDKESIEIPDQKEVEERFEQPTNTERDTLGARDTDKSAFSTPPNLSLDQDVLQDTYAKGTVASSSSIQQSNKQTVSQRSYGRKSEKSLFSRLVSWIISLLIIGTLFFSSMYVLNETKIYENNFFSIIQGFTGVGFLSDSSNIKYRRSIQIRDDSGAWYSSKQGQVYVVSGQIVNRSENSVNFVKLKSEFLSTGEKLFEQEFYSGNTLSNWEIKNSSFEAINKKLNRKTGDINYEDVDNLAGLNFDIQPGESIPFYTVFPAKNKILGLKHKIKVIGLETSTLEEKGE